MARSSPRERRIGTNLTVRATPLSYAAHRREVDTLRRQSFHCIRVSVQNDVPSRLTPCRDKILAMDGGGQDSVAYILLYR